VLNFLNENAGTIQAGLAMLVAMATVLYTVITSMMFREMGRTNKHQVEQIHLLERSMRGTTYQSLIEGASAINQIFVARPELASLWQPLDYVGTNGPFQRVSEAWVVTMMMDFYENMFFQHEQGNVPEPIWKRWETHIGNVFRQTKVREHWAKARSVYYTGFQQFVDGLLKDA
jgi:hypothetical protein